jgi:hypothetical protein
MSIVPEAAMVDIDALRIDLGLGSAIVAFQVKGTESDRILSYKIYSLEKSPRLLRTITGGTGLALPTLTWTDRLQSGLTNRRRSMELIISLRANSTLLRLWCCDSSNASYSMSVRNSSGISIA